MDTLRIGMIPPAGADGVAPRDSIFADEVGRALGVRAQVHHAADYRGLVAALENGLIQMAWVPPIAAARGIRSATLLPVVITRRNGTTSYLACLFARKSSGIESPHVLSGARAAWVDRESASGYVCVRAALRAAGISLVGAFAEDHFARSHAEVARMVRDGRADVGATYLSYEAGTVGVARAGWRDGGLTDDEVVVIAHAGPIPSDMLAVHATVSRGHVAALQSALLDARPRSLFEAGKALLSADGFVRCDEQHLAQLRAMLELVDATPTTMRPPPPAGRA
jgi:phosphonate transport system substrate-binding protein